MKKYFLAGLMGFGISVGCLLPPILHFITGPLGPFIGGFFGGMKVRANLLGAVVIGLTMGFFLSAFLMFISWLIITFQDSFGGMMNKMMPADIFASASFWKIALGAFAIGTALATAGALLGGFMMNRKSES